MTNDLTQTTQRALDEQVMNSLGRLQEQGLEMPPSYSPQNALKSAYFELVNNTAGNLIQMAANNVEVKTSISNALLDMVIQGLSPAKKQAYFIKYGNKVQLMRSYFGTMAVLERVTGGADIRPAVVHEGDEFEVEMNGPDMKITNHQTKFENLDNEIKAAYVVIKLQNGQEYTTVMTKKQIDQSWAKSKMKGLGPQKEFPDEMAKRTVINRAAKYLINTSNDDDLFIQAAKETLENEFDEREVKQAEPVQVQELENKLQNKLGIKSISEQEVIQTEIPIKDESAQRTETIEFADSLLGEETTRVANVPGHPEIEQAHIIKEDVSGLEPKQEQLDITPNFDREEGVVDDSEDDYPF